MTKPSTLIKHGFCKGVQARDAWGQPVSWYDPDAVAFSVEGAILASNGNSRRVVVGAVERVLEGLRLEKKGEAALHAIRAWNDASFVTQTDAYLALKQVGL
jgi:hypothetical protein